MNLLIVNDAVVEVQTMQENISWISYGIDHVYTASCTEEGRAVITLHSIDILLCDIEMPGEDGIALIRWIRENGYDIDCILLTCHADFAYAQEAVSLNCMEYLLLPAKYEQIGASVMKVVKKRMQRLSDKKLQEYGENWIRKHTADMGAEPDNSLKPQNVVQECKKYVLDHLGDAELNLTDIASHFYLTPIYLNRIFKKEIGTSINQWIIQERMQLAAHLLQTTNHSAVTVAKQVGYNNYPYFSTVFKKFFGCNPSQYGTQEGK